MENKEIINDPKYQKVDMSKFIKREYNQYSIKKKKINNITIQITVNER